MKLWIKILYIEISVYLLQFGVIFSIDIGNVNRDFDKTLPFVRSIIKSGEPLVSPPMRDYIDYCNITGFSTIFRSGNLTSVKINESVSRLYLHLGWKRLVIACRIHNKVLSIKVSTAIVIGVIDNLSIYTDAIVNYDDDHHTRIRKAKIVNPGTFQMQYYGEGFLGKTIQFFVRLIKPVITKLVHSLVVETVEIMIHKTKHHLGLIGGQLD